MDTQAEQLLRTALSLDPHDRAEIAASLIASLDPHQDEDIGAAWDEEVARRIASIDKGEVGLIASDEVMRSLRERLHG